MKNKLILDKILEVSLLIECVKDACVFKDYYAGESVLNRALEIQMDIYEQIDKEEE